MEVKVGYSLIDQNNNEVEFWGNSIGNLVGKPDMIILPTGDSIHDPSIGEPLMHKYKLLERFIDATPKTEWDEKISENIIASNKKVVVYYNYKTPDINIIKTKVKEKIAAKRWEKETAGIDFIDLHFSTDRESQLKYATIKLSLQSNTDPNWKIQWKTKDPVFVELNAETFTRLATEVEKYVQETYLNEKQMFEKVDSIKDIPSLSSFDLESGWPDQKRQT